MNCELALPVIVGVAARATMSSSSQSTALVVPSGSLGGEVADASTRRRDASKGGDRSTGGTPGNAQRRGQSGQNAGTKRQAAGGKAAKGAKKKEQHTLDRPEYPNPELGRVVITSAMTLQSDWRKLPIDVLAECILFLDCAREWVFHQHKGEAAYAFYKTGFDAR